MLRSLRDTALRFGAAGPVALFTAIGPLVGAVVLTATAPLWLEWFLASGAVGAVVFLALTALLAGLSLTPTHASSLLGGMAFGFGLGSALAITGVTLAAALGFVVLRHFLRDRVVDALSHHPRAEAVHRALDQDRGVRTLALLVLIRLSPVVPFAATNLLMSTTGVRLVPYLVGSALGLAPRVLAVVWIGSSLTELDLSQAADRRLLVVGIAATVAALFVLGRASRRGLARMQGA